MKVAGVDVLTVEHLEEAWRAMGLPFAPRVGWIGPPWAAEHLKKHDAGKAGCARCLKAWSVMVPA